MKERELRRRCRKLLKQLDIGPPLDVEVLCARLGEQRGKPIRLMAYPLEVPGPFGCWIATSSADYIFYQAETTKSHQDHIILHELGHMLADHHPHGDAEPADFLRGPAPDLTVPIVTNPTTATAEWLSSNGQVPSWGRPTFGPISNPDAVHRALRRSSYDDAHEWEAETVATIILEWASVLNYTIPRRPADRDLRRIQGALGDHQGWL